MRLIKSSRLWIVAWSAVFALSYASAQKIEGYKHTSWTAEDGGPTSVRSIAQSADGFIWIAATNGLFRFDGASFETMPVLNDPELGDHQPSVVHASPNGDVYIGYRPGAVAVYRRGRLHNLHMPNPPEFITRVAADGKGGVWVVSGRDRSPLSHYRAGKWHELGQAEGVPVGQVHWVFVDRSGTTWITQTDRILFLRPGGRRFETSPARVAKLSAIGQGPDGSLWLADRMGVRPLPDYPNGATDPALPANEPATGAARSIWFDQTGNVWGTDNTRGLFRLLASQLRDPAARARASYFTTADGLTSNAAFTSLIDRESNIWVGTNLGLDRLRKVSAHPQMGLGAPSLSYAGESDSGGTIYIEDDAGIHAIGPRGEVRLVSNHSGEISTPCRRRDGSVLSFIPGALLQLRPNGVTIVGAGPRFPPYGCAEDASGRLWIWSGEEGLSWQGRAGWQSLPMKSVRTAGGLSSSPWGVAFLQVSATGLMRLDPGRQTMIKASAFGVGAFYSVNEGRRDLLISGTRGLARVRRRAVRTIDGVRHPWLTRLRSLLQTRRGDTWMQSPVGIVRVRTSDLDRAFEQPRAPLPYDLFDAADGVVSSSQKSGIWGRQILEGGDGIVRFLTSTGVVTIDPSAITRNNLPPPVVVSSLTSRGVRYLDPTVVDLPAGSASVAIAYSALSLSVPERVRFRYRLEGVDDDWVDPGKRREAVYGNLVPGTYRFQVTAANNDGVWNKQGAILLIRIAPAFHQTIWFYALCLVAAGLLVWWAYAARVRHLTARIQATMSVRLAERERIARELHDTLLQTFQGLVLQFQAAANRLPSERPARDALEKALRSADAALAEGRNRVRDLRDDGVNGDLTKEWVALAAELGTHRPVRFDLIVEGKPRELHPLVQDELQRLGAEALRNAYQHAGASLIEIIVGYRANILRLDIRDNGVGLPSAIASDGQRSGHYGLVGMRERARRIGAMLSIVSREGEGTEVLVSVPGKAAYVERSRWPAFASLWSRKGSR
jgi:signal transduction histidine kinase/ligand-binding sensor domain-containing protein